MHKQKNIAKHPTSFQFLNQHRYLSQEKNHNGTLAYINHS